MGDVLSFKCPCCTAALSFSGDTGEMTCEYCGASFTVEQAKAAQEAEKQDAASSDMTWTTAEPSMIRDEDGKVSGYVCSSCGAEMVADDNTAATECPYCGNNAIMPHSFDGMYRPDLVVPFTIDRKAAQEALRAYYRGKKLLPDSFTDKNRIENITGLYVPFWLMSCHADGWVSYEGIKEKKWEDSHYRYEKKDHYRATRRGGMDFERIPSDASTKMDDNTMDSLEPYDFSKGVGYDAAYFSGYLADRYDVRAEEVQPRASERVQHTFRDKMRDAANRDYDSLSQKGEAIRISDTRTEYAMLPVWMLSTKYEGTVYSFAMNGQSGKVAGSLPIDKGKYWKYFFIALLIGAAVVLGLSFLLMGHRIRTGAAIAAAVIGLLSGFLYAGHLKSAMNTVAQQHTAKSYLLDHSVRMGQPSDMFLFSKLDKQEKSQKSSGQQPAAAQRPQSTQRPAATNAQRPQSAQRPAAANAQRPQNTQRPAAANAQRPQRTQRPTTYAQRPQSTQRPTTNAQRPQSAQRPTATNAQRPQNTQRPQKPNGGNRPGGTSR